MQVQNVSSTNFTGLGQSSGVAKVKSKNFFRKLFTLNHDAFEKTSNKDLHEHKSVAKNLKWMDLYNLRFYMLGKQTALGIKKSEFNNLLNFEGEELISKSLDLMFSKLNLPNEIKPKIMYIEADSDAAMLYSQMYNSIIVNLKHIKNTDKAGTIGAVRHEFQHFRQNMDILRHDEYGPEAIKLFSKKISEEEIKSIEYNAANYSIEELKAAGFTESAIKDYEKLKAVMLSGDVEKYNLIIDETKNLIEKNAAKTLNEIRENVINSVGRLDNTTAKGLRTKKYFEDLLPNNNYWEKEGKVNYFKYYKNSSEVEAISSASYFLFNFLEEFENVGCYLKVLKQAASKNAFRYLNFYMYMSYLLRGKEKSNKMFKDNLSKVFN